MGTSPREGFEPVFVGQKWVSPLIYTPQNSNKGEKKSCIYYNEVFLSHAVGGGYLLNSKVEIFSFISKLLEIVKKVKSDVISQDVPSD